MRDLFVTLVVFGAIPFILMRPMVGIIIWNWLAYMNPHRLAFGFAYSFPFSLVVAVVTFMAVLISAEPKRFPWQPITVVWILFVLWISLTTVFALEPEAAMLGWERSIKIQIFALLTLMLVTSKQRIDLLVWTIALSLGFFGIKGGMFTILTGGSYTLHGPPGGFFEENNALGLGLLMILPLFRYMQTTITQRFLRLGLIAAIGLVAVAVLATYSRGAFVGVVAMLSFLVLKSRYKIATGLVLVIVIPLLLLAMPEKWFDRMNSIGEYQTDGSAQSRINSWGFAFNLSLDHPVMGGGFNTFTPVLFLKYAPNPAVFGDAHSIYFQMLAEHGYVGLLLFLSLLVLAYRTGSWIIRHTKNQPELAWANRLAGLLQLSLVGYAASGAFLGLAYLDLFYSIAGLLVVSKVIVQKALLAKALPLSVKRGISGAPLPAGVTAMTGRR